jgi:hypothetical protein
MPRQFGQAGLPRDGVAEVRSKFGSYGLASESLDKMLA